MHILEKCLMFVFCQRRRVKDQQQIQGYSAGQLVEQQEVTCPGRRILLEGRSRSNRRASHSPAQLETISICADVHQQPDVVPEPRRNSGFAIEDDIEILAPNGFKAATASSQPQQTLM